MGGKINMEKDRQPEWAEPSHSAIRMAHQEPNLPSTMKELIRRSAKDGFFSSCCGGGLGVATGLENLQR